MTSVPLQDLKKNGVCLQYLVLDLGTQEPCILCIHKNRRNFDNNKLKTAVMCVCFQRQRVRHNANYIAYVQMLGCSLCSIFTLTPMIFMSQQYVAKSHLHVAHTVVPVMNGHPRDQAKVSVHCRWPLVTGTDGQAGDAKYNTHCNNTYYYHHQRYS